MTDTMEATEREPVRANARTSPSHFACPACGSHMIIIADSRPSKAIGEVGTRRRRACRDCSHRWSTIEVSEAALNGLVRTTLEAAACEILRFAKEEADAP